MKFKTKLVSIEAEQYDGSKESIAKILTLGNSVLLYNDHLIIKTLKGNRRADKGDWIIKDIKGEFYSFKDDIFQETYERVDEDDWNFLSANASAILPSRWNILWNHIIRRKPLNYTLEAWVHSDKKLGETTLRIVWR